eukprot:40169-Prymnesium_polylepis.1
MHWRVVKSQMRTLWSSEPDAKYRCSFGWNLTVHGVRSWPCSVHCSRQVEQLKTLTCARAAAHGGRRQHPPCGRARSHRPSAGMGHTQESARANRVVAMRARKQLAVAGEGERNVIAAPARLLYPLACGPPQKFYREAVHRVVPLALGKQPKYVALKSSAAPAV